MGFAIAQMLPEDHLAMPAALQPYAVNCAYLTAPGVTEHFNSERRLRLTGNSWNRNAAQPARTRRNYRIVN